MADQAVDVNDVFIYTGGRAPQHVVNVIIDKSVKEIDYEAFFNNLNLRSVEFHDGVERIGRVAFGNCPMLRRIKLSGVRLIQAGAFRSCTGLEDVEFGDRLETIGFQAFFNCISLRNITMPSVRTIGEGAFDNCKALTEAEFGKELAGFGEGSFIGCNKLRRIAIPLKDDMFTFSELYQGYNQFYSCHKLATVDKSVREIDRQAFYNANLSTVDLVGGGIHKTIRRNN